MMRRVSNREKNTTMITTTIKMITSGMIRECMNENNDSRVSLKRSTSPESRRTAA